MNNKLLRQISFTILLILVSALILPAAYLQVVSMQGLPTATRLVDLLNIIDRKRKVDASPVTAEG